MTIFKKIQYASLILLAACTTPDQKETELKRADSTTISSKTTLDTTENTKLKTQLISQGLTNIADVDPDILVDLKYSSTDNFFKKDVYGDLKEAFMQPDVATRLKKVNKALKNINPNYSLIIYDAVRPLSVQYVLWNALDSIPPSKRKAFVADPAQGSIHNYGCALDLSIYDRQIDSVLDMGTKYDYFGDLAYPRKEAAMLAKGLLDSAQVHHRQILRTAMKNEAFIPITSEWWHFNCTSLARAKKMYKIVK